MGQKILLQITIQQHSHSKLIVLYFHYQDNCAYFHMNDLSVVCLIDVQSYISA